MIKMRSHHGLQPLGVSVPPAFSEQRFPLRGRHCWPADVVRTALSQTRARCYIPLTDRHRSVGFAVIASFLKLMRCLL